MNFFFAKMFEALQRNRKGEAVFRLRSYIGILYFLSGFDCYLIVAEAGGLKLNPAFGICIILLLSLLLAHSNYIKNGKIYSLEKKFKDRSMNSFLLYFLIIFIPVLLLITGPTIIVLLKGGAILGHRIVGIF